MANSAIHALTSLSPTRPDTDYVRSCIQSWRDAGLTVRSFNHPSEIPELARRFDVEFVPVTRTTADLFGRHFVPVRALLEWAAGHDAPVLLINGDIQLRLLPWEMQRLRWVSEGGLCCFFRYNYADDPSAGTREPHGIDAFLLHGRDERLFGDSFLSFGQPFWDYWLPDRFHAGARPVYRVEYPAAFHRSHPSSWSWDSWYRCALEFDRLTGHLDADKSFDQCQLMCERVRRQITSSPSIGAAPGDIRQWLQARFGGPGRKTFLELGAHTGTDTVWLAKLPGVTLHALEPDPRNVPPPHPNVFVHRLAIAERDGRVPFLLSREGWGKEWTYSSSIRAPKNHLRWYPVTFGPTIEVEAVSLDSLVDRFGLGPIDFIWADIQGAEGDMIRGGSRALARTRYLYTEYSDDELYEGQPSLAEIKALLPDFSVIELWPGDVLLENRALRTGH